MEKIVKHDGDGKLYYADNNGIPNWLMEVEIYEADMVENAINRLFEERALANDSTSEKDLRVCEVIASYSFTSIEEKFPPKNETYLVYNSKNGRYDIEYFTEKDCFGMVKTYLSFVKKWTHYVNVKQLPKPL